MLANGIQPSMITYTSLIHVLSKSKRMVEAADLFEKAEKKVVTPDLVMFNALISDYCVNTDIKRSQH